MKCMEYSNANHINIIPKSDFEDLVIEVFQVIADNISKSLGPLGSSATIFDGTLVEATKDGYHILDRYRFNNRYKKMIYNLIKTPCTKMNNTVGDGTTTAIVLTNEIYKSYKDKEKELYRLYRLPRDFVKTWDNVVETITSKMASGATQVDSSDYDTIYKLAYVSSNGNHAISDSIAKAYAESGSPSIKVKDSPTNKSYLEAVSGFEFPTNLIHEVFVHNEDYTSFEKNAAVIILDHNLETDEYKGIIEPLNDVFRAKGHKLVVVAPKYDEVMFDTAVRKYISYEVHRYGGTNLVLTQYRQGALKSHQLEDLATILGSVVLSKGLVSEIIPELEKVGPDNLIESADNEESVAYKMFGKASTIMLSKDNGSIFDSDSYKTDENYQNTLKRAIAELDDIKAHTDFEKQSYAAKIHEARTRVLNLQMKNYIYYVGADSDLQKQIYKDAIDDVIKCVSSSVKNGTVPGCQISIIKACDEYLHEIIDDEELVLNFAITKIIRDACIKVYSMVLNGPNGDGIAKAFGVDDGVQSYDITLTTISESVKRGKVFDLDKLEYDDNIITSAETDSMVLMAASELIKILISGNQCIYVDADVNNSHQEEADIYA